MEINPNFKKVAIRVAKEAGGILEKDFKKPIKVSLKKDSSLITNVDFKTEKAIIKLIKKNFPSHDILSEEAGGKIRGEYRWVIDPLDGTTNYVLGFPFFSTSIALLYKGNPILGIIFNPITKELYFAEKGRGSFLNGKKIKVTEKKKLSRTVMLLDKGRTEENFIKFQKILRKISKLCRSFRVWGSSTLELCQVAAGRVDGFIDIGGKPWDYAAGILIVKEAGGRVTDSKGKEWQMDAKDVIASNKEIHNQLLKLIK